MRIEPDVLSPLSDAEATVHAPAHELMLTAVRGESTRFNDKTKSRLEAPRTKHSEKPVEVRDMLRRASPGPYLEIFARARVGCMGKRDCKGDGGMTRAERDAPASAALLAALCEHHPGREDDPPVYDPLERLAISVA